MSTPLTTVTVPKATPEEMATYEGRRKAWARWVASDQFSQARSALRTEAMPDEKPRCCCLGVACEMILVSEPDLIERFDSYMGKFVYGEPNPELRDPTRLYKAVHDLSPTENFELTTGFLPQPAADWLGVEPKPLAVLDEQFVAEWTAWREAEITARLESTNPDDEIEDKEKFRAEAFLIDGLGMEPGAEGPAEDGMLAFLHTLNDSEVPFDLIAGLIERERISAAKTGPAPA